MIYRFPATKQAYYDDLQEIQGSTCRKLQASGVALHHMDVIFASWGGKNNVISAH